MTTHKYIMKINLQVLNHLGLNLYSNKAAVLSEVVANAWDADATEVHIDINDKEKNIIISDNGNGMDLNDINEKYLNVGYQKRKYCSISEVFNRKVMGRKGIGKLSLFSIANIVKVYSCKNGKSNGFKIDTLLLKNAIEKDDSYYPEEISAEAINIPKNGTVIVLENLKQGVNSLLPKYLKQRLARRFAIIGDKNKFKVFVNKEAITIEDRNYLPKAQCVWIYSPDSTQCDYEEDVIKQTNKAKLIFKEVRDSRIKINDKTYNLKGWIATCSEPKELNDDGENLNRIVIMVRGKMAKEDIFSEIGTTSLYSKYIFGEISADFLDLDNEDDITTSSRQDFFEDDKRYIVLKDFIKKELSSIRNKWEEKRGDIGVNEACKYKIVNTWYEGLAGDQRTAAKKLFGKINQLTVESDAKKDLFLHGIMAFETFKFKDELSQLDSISTENLEPFLHIAGRLENIEATLYYQIVKGRLAVIKKMQEVVRDGSLERLIQLHLSNHLWLLDPSWDMGTELPSVEESFKAQFKEITNGLTEKERDARLDIRYKKTSNMHVIIELKKGNRVVKSDELNTQVKKYFTAMTKILEKANSHEPFQIIVLLGKKLDGDNANETVYRATLNALEHYNCRIMYYDELLKNAELLYGDFIAKNKYLAFYTNIIKEIGSNNSK